MTTIHSKTVAICTNDAAYVMEGIRGFVENRRYHRSRANSSSTEAIKVLLHLLHPDGSNKPGEVRCFRFGKNKQNIITVDPKTGSIQYTKDNVHDDKVSQELNTYFSEEHKKQCIEVLSTCIQEYEKELAAKGNVHDKQARKDLIKIVQLASDPKLGLLDRKTADELIRKLKDKKSTTANYREVLDKLEAVLRERHGECAKRSLQKFSWVQQALERAGALLASKSAVAFKVVPFTIPPGVLLPKAALPRPEPKGRVNTVDTGIKVVLATEEGKHGDFCNTKVTDLLLAYGEAQANKQEEKKHKTQEERIAEDTQLERIRRILAKFPDLSESAIDLKRNYREASDTDIEAYFAGLARVVHPRESKERLKAKEIPATNETDRVTSLA